jgi:EpsI family protein
VFPLAFLLFAVPVNVLDSLGFWLRLWVIKASAGLAHAAGIGVLQSGTQLFAPDGRYNYDVAAACSGVRSLMALAALSLLVGYLSFRGATRRALVLLLCFPLVYLGNVARIASIVFAAQWLGPAWGTRAHDVMGYGVFVIVLGGVLAAVAAMQRWWPDGDQILTQVDDIVVVRTAKGEIETRVVAIVVALAIGELFFLNKLAHLPPRGAAGVLLASDGKNPADLPAILGRAWVGTPAAVTPIEREILPSDTGYARMNYTATRDGRRVFLSIVLSGRDRTSIHRPELCLIGQGWTITGAAEQRFDYPEKNGAAFPATVLRVQREVATPRGREVVPQVVAYWFVGGDAVVATHWQRLARDAWNRVIHARADRWAYVVLQTDATDGETAALARMQAVLNETLPAFQPPVTVR